MGVCVLVTCRIRLIYKGKLGLSYIFSSNWISKPICSIKYFFLRRRKFISSSIFLLQFGVQLLHICIRKKKVCIYTLVKNCAFCGSTFVAPFFHLNRKMYTAPSNRILSVFFRIRFGFSFLQKKFSRLAPNISVLY